MDLVGFYSISAYNSHRSGLKDNENFWEKKPKLGPTISRRHFTLIGSSGRITTTEPHTKQSGADSPFGGEPERRRVMSEHGGRILSSLRRSCSRRRSISPSGCTTRSLRGFSSAYGLILLLTKTLWRCSSLGPPAKPSGLLELLPVHESSYCFQAPSMAAVSW